MLTLGDTATAVPQNVAVSLTSDCVDCLTYGPAVQLFATLDGPLSDGARADLDALWSEIAAYGAHLEEVPPSDIRTGSRPTSSRSSTCSSGTARSPCPRGRRRIRASPSPAEPTSQGPSSGGTAAPGETGSPTSEPSPAGSTGATPSASPTATATATATP